MSKIELKILEEFSNQTAIMDSIDSTLTRMISSQEKNSKILNEQITSSNARLDALAGSVNDLTKTIESLKTELVQTLKTK